MTNDSNGIPVPNFPNLKRAADFYGENSFTEPVTVTVDKIGRVEMSVHPFRPGVYNMKSLDMPPDQFNRVFNEQQFLAMLGLLD